MAKARRSPEEEEEEEEEEKEDGPRRGRGASTLREDGVHAARGRVVDRARLRGRGPRATRRAPRPRTPSPNSDATTTRPSRSRGSSTKALPSGIEPPPPGSILVVAPSLHAARDAKRDLERALERALRSPKLQYTHFVCVPLCFGDDGERLVATVRAFHRDVLSSAYAADCDIEPSIAHEPGHAHLTLCMLKLYSDEARARAIGAMDAMGVALKDSASAAAVNPSSWR